jgi:hypothetical protein
MYQRYLTLAQEAARRDDRIAAENYYQHAEHYFRVNNESRGDNLASTSHPIDRDTADAAAMHEPSETAIAQAQPQTDGDQSWSATDLDR